jgi:predicted permease
MNVVKQLFGSKKFITALVGLILNVVTIFLPADAVTAEMKAQLMTVITILCGVFILGQGVADHGKEAKKIEAASASSTPPVAGGADAGADGN